MAKVTLRIPDHIAERLKDVAMREGRSFNNEVVHTMVEYLKDEGYEIDMVEDRSEDNTIKPNQKENAG